MKPMHLLARTLLCSMLVVLASCSATIFQTIENERKTETNTLSETITVRDIVALPAPIAPATNTFYIAAGGIFQGQLISGSITWTPDSSGSDRPFNPTDLICNGLAYSSGTSTLWGAFISNQDGTTSLRQSQGSGATYPYTFDGTSPISDAAVAGKHIISVQVVNGHIFVVTANSPTDYELVESLDGSTWTVRKTGISSRITGIAYAGLNNYWMVAGTSVYTETTAGAPTFPGAPTSTLAGVTITSQINGVFATSAGVVIIVTKEDGVFWSNDRGGTWHYMEADSVGSTTVSYLCAAGPVDTTGGNYKYLIGSDGYGYYTLVASGSGSLERFDDNTVALYLESVAKITVDLIGGVHVLMGTNATGLWRTVFDSGTGDIASGSAWIHE